MPARNYDGKPFRIWQEVDSFVDTRDQTVYVADRFTGRIAFAPALHLPGEDPNGPATPLAAVPAADREIRAWYRCGGGSDGQAPKTFTYHVFNRSRFELLEQRPPGSRIGQ